jgi:raffinose/stachyose/melibiose transport system permease protein
VPALLVYVRAFSTGQVGSAAAIAVVLTVLVLAVTLLLTRLVEEGDE